MSLKKYIRKNIYRWHRVTSLVIAVPVIMWTLSGFLYPIMNSFKPNVRNQVLPPLQIDTRFINLPLQQALAQNKIEQLHNFRIVQLNKMYYYQVCKERCDTLTYISCTTGRILKNGDQLYAGYLAQRYLSEPLRPIASSHSHNAHGTMAAALRAMPVPVSSKSFSKSAPVKNIQFTRSFNSEYKRSNVLLPVYRVCFQRNDDIRLYIETSTDRLAYAADTRKAWFTRFFSITHSWSFLNGLGQWKNVFLGGFSALCFVSSVFGFYVYNMTNKKEPKSIKTVNRGRSWHRSIGNFFLVTTLLFSLSGAWHSFSKLSETRVMPSSLHHQGFKSSELGLPFAAITNSLSKNETLSGVSAVKMNGTLFWQLSVSNKKGVTKRYIHAKTLNELINGDTKYGSWLASTFSGKSNGSISSARTINNFNHEYNMMFKRLPVIQVSYDNNEKYFVETSTGYLSAVTTESSRAERFSFSNLHMHHFWEMWFGKNVGKKLRNAVLILSTAGLLLLALTGIMIYIRKRFRTG